MIATVSEIKELLQITDSTNDSLIETLIPIIEDEIFEYTQNYFINQKIRYNSTSISFSNSSTPIICDTNSLFLTNNFNDNCHINIYGSKYNDGNYKVSTVSAGYMYLDSTESLITESAENNIYVTYVVYPKNLKIIISNMIKFAISKQDLSVKSESIDDYSATYNIGSSNYPDPILNALNKYKMLRW